MPKIIVSGCNGHMGQSVVNLCSGMDDVEIPAASTAPRQQKNGFPVYSNPMEYTGEADVVIDFSNPANLSALLAFAVEREGPRRALHHRLFRRAARRDRAAARKVPVFKSGNMSLGINLMMRLAREAAAVLGGSFDVEILERHHNRKLDAPSGTALMLADAVAEGLPHESEYVYERHSVRRKRRREEIGISSMRGGTIVGEHELMFAGPTRSSRSSTPRSAATSSPPAPSPPPGSWPAKTEPGLYDMDDLLSARCKSENSGYRIPGHFFMNGPRLRGSRPAHGVERELGEVLDLHAQQLRALRDDVAGAAGRELLVLELLHDALGVHALVAGGAHLRRGPDEAGELVAGEEELLHLARGLHVAARCPSRG